MKLIPVFLLFFALAPFHARSEERFDFADAARRAVEVSGELRSEYAARAMREGAWLYGVRAYLPRFGITASEDDRVSEIGADSFLKNYSLNVEQLLWDGGRLSLSRKMEKAELDMAGSKIKQTAGNIADAAVSAYRDVIRGRKILEIREKTLEFFYEQRRILQRELELGLVRPIDLAEAEITVAGTELEIRSLAIDLEKAEWNFAEKLGLEKLPFLSEQIDTERNLILPPPETARSLAESRNPDLAALRYSIAGRQAELRAASLSWIPSLRLTGSFGLSGSHYPLSRYSWSVGLNVDFASPWISGTTGASFGKDPPHDRNARIQQTVTPASDPASSFSARQAELALRYECSRYETTLKEVRAAVDRGIRQCALLDNKRLLARERMELEKKKFNLAEVRLSLGEIRRVDLIEALLDYSMRESELVDSAALVLQAERELERILDIEPGKLSVLAERNVI